MLIWLFTRIVLPILVILGLFWWRLDAGVQRGLDAVRPFAHVTRGRTFFGLNGDIGVTRLTVTPQINTQSSVGFSADSLTFQTPGLWWLLKTSIMGISGPPTRFGMTLQNVEVNGAPKGRGTDLIGLYTGSPFEAEGCGVNEWTRSDLAEMGLPRHSGYLRWLFDLSRKEELIATIDWDMEGAGNSELLVSFKLPTDITRGASDQAGAAMAGAELNSAKITFTDQGFVAARNRYCAKQLKLTEAQFIDRHIAAVRRVLMAAGLAPEGDVEQTYRRFAMQGGEMSIQLRPQVSMNVVALRALNAGNWQDMLSPIIASGNANPILMRLHAVPKIPLTNAGDALLAANPEGSAAPDSTSTDLIVVEATPPTASTAATSAAGTSSSELAIDYDDLAQHIGERVVVRSVYDSVRTGTLVKFYRSALTLKLDNGAELTVPSNTVRSTALEMPPAEPAPAAPPTTGNRRAKEN